MDGHTRLLGCFKSRAKRGLEQVRRHRYPASVRYVWTQVRRESLYYLYEDDLQLVVTENFKRLGYPIERHHVELIKGKVQDTLVINEPVALAHVDVDWYEPVTACLERITPNLVVGGSIALHAYGDWSGCLKATDDYFGRVGKDQFKFDTSAGHMLVTRKPGRGL